MTHRMRHVSRTAFIFFFIALFTLGALAQTRLVQGVSTPAGTDPVTIDDITAPAAVMVELTDLPSAASYHAVTSRGGGRSQAAQAARSQKVRNEQAQQALLRVIPGAVANARILYRVQSAYNGIAVQVSSAAEARALAALPGVKSVHIIPLVERGNASSVGLIGSPAVWQNLGLTGTNIKVGVIDTGIDYVHTNFGGPGTAAAYTAARGASANTVTTSLPITNGATAMFPSAKVVGGWDFAGDGYNADPATSPYNPVPSPDPNPEDCPTSLGGGHGSHVSGTIGGYGVNGDGTTYGGPYDTAVPTGSMRIGPGVAPGVQLYALRVFGCVGSTTLTTAAIDWSTDPNDDGDPSDHLDVINMSLGASYGTPDDASAVASNNAASVGVIVVASAGNEGDLYYVSGSPGSATRVLTVASTVDTVDTVDAFAVTAPAAYAGTKIATFSSAFNWAASSPLTTSLVYVPTNTTGCTAFAAGSLTGKTVLVDWAPAGTSTFPCGSAVRANNAQAGGASGIIMASGQTFFDTAIAGNAAVRAVFTTLTVGNELKAALASGPTSVTFSYNYLSTGRFVNAGADDTVSTFSSRGGRGRDSALKPDISAPGQTIFSTNSGTGTLGRSLNGTSMAAPHIAGVMAVLRQAHPTWSVEELKALAMNTASNDLYTGLNQTGTKFAPPRVGAGRVNVPNATAGDVIAYSADVEGAVGVSYGALEIIGTTQFDRTIRVVNKGSNPASYSIAYDSRTSIPGVAISFPDGTSVNVPAGDSATFRVRLTANAASMKNSHDATVVEVQGTNPRQWANEASGLVTLTPSSGVTLRVPLHAVARPASVMAGPAAIVFANATASTTVPLSGTGVSTGAVGPAEHNAVVTAMELALSKGPESLSPAFSPFARNADIKYVGVTSARTNAANASRVNNSTVYFGVATHANWTTPATEVSFNVFIDVDRNGTSDYQLFSTRFASTDTFVTALAKLPSTSGTVQSFTNVLSSSTPTAIYNSNVAVLPVNVTGTTSGVVMPAGATRFNYRVVTSSRFWGTISSTGWMTYDYVTPGVDFNPASNGAPMYFDTPGATLPAKFDQTAYNANGSQGVLLLHHYNSNGARAQLVAVKLATTLTVPTASAQYTDPITLTANVSPAVSGSVEFFISGTSVGTAPVNSGVATLSGIANSRVVGAYAVTAQFTSSNSGYADSSGSGTLNIVAEDARVTYGGALFATTSSSSSSTATVLLAATVQDITAVTSDPSYDPYAGDIRNATVTFVNRDAGDAVLCTTSSLVLLNPSDTKTATANCSWTPNIGNSDSVSFTVGIVVGGYYVRNAAADDVIVTVAKPIAGSVNAGGYVVNQNSSGQVPGDSGALTHFGFNAKTNRNTTNVNGHVNIIVRYAGRVYQIKGTNISSLVTKTSDPGAKTATFTGKAVIQDITDPANILSVDGNASLQVTMTDRGEPGTTDSVGITLWNKNGGLWYSSRWAGNKTTEQVIGGGNISVR